MVRKSSWSSEYARFVGGGGLSYGKTMFLALSVGKTKESRTLLHEPGGDDPTIRAQRMAAVITMLQARFMYETLLTLGTCSSGPIMFWISKPRAVKTPRPSIQSATARGTGEVPSRKKP